MDQISLLQKQIEHLTDAVNNKQDHTTINNVYNNNFEKVIVLNNFGEERIDHLTENLLLTVFEDKDPAYLAQQIHFSIEAPENKNIRLRDDTTVEIFKNKQWIPQDVNFTLTDLLQRDWRYLRVKCNTMKKKVILENKINPEDYDETHKWWETMCRDEAMQEHYKDEILTLMKDEQTMQDDEDP